MLLPHAQGETRPLKHSLKFLKQRDSPLIKQTVKSLICDLFHFFLVSQIPHKQQMLLTYKSAFLHGHFSIFSSYTDCKERVTRLMCCAACTRAELRMSRQTACVRVRVFVCTHRDAGRPRVQICFCVRPQPLLPQAVTQPLFYSHLLTPDGPLRALHISRRHVKAVHTPRCHANTRAHALVLVRALQNKDACRR